MNSRTSSILIVLLTVAMVLVPAFGSEPSDAAEPVGKEVVVEGVTFHTFVTSVDIDANSSCSFIINIHNTTDSAKRIVIHASPSTGDLTASIDLSDEDGILEGRSDSAGSSCTAKITISAEKFAQAGSYTIELKATVTDLNTSSIKSGSIDLPMKVTSKYATGDQFNKILGYITNPIDELNKPLFNAAVTAVIWVFLAIIVSAFITHVVIRRLLQQDNGEVRSEGAKELKSIRRLLFVIVILFGIANCMRVAGAEESVVGAFTDVFNIVAYAVGALLFWKAYKVAVYNIVVRMDKMDKVDDSILPLLYMVGKIVISIVAVSLILSVLGLNLGAIVASAGLVTLGISLGAQNTLNQFFCGMVLMATRPFRIGDKIKLGTDGEVLIVRKISVMDTEFKNWLNEEVFRIPNSTVMASTIVNITMDDKSYKVIEYFDISYDEDVNKARDIIMDVINSHPKVIKDGSKERPTFRLESLEASSVRLRATYIVPDHEIFLTVSGQIKEAVFRRFKAEGVEIPHNVYDIHMVEE